MAANKHALITLAVLGALAGCSSTKLDAEVPVESRTPANSLSANTTPGTGANANPNASSSGTAQSAVTPVDLTKTATVAMGNLPRVVYFDFDSYIVKDEFRPTVESYAKVLAADRNKRLAIEGPHRRPGRARIQPGAGPEARRGSRQVACVAGRQRHPGRRGEFRQGAPGSAGQ